VHRYVRRSKTDRTDAKALLEADRNDEIHAVPVKTIEQQSIAALHRIRSTWLATRTSRINTVRGLLREFGVVIPVGSHHVVPQVRELLATSPHVPDLIRTSLSSACDEITTVEQHMRAVERQLTSLARERDDCKLLQTIPGVGPLTATALVALVGNVHRFASSREFASFLGLTPREDSSADRRRLGSISKHGDVYVRMLLTHGARSVLVRAHGAGNATAFQRWARNLQLRRGHNIATVAVANKLARIIWAVWTHQRPFAVDHRTTSTAPNTTSSHLEDCIESN
jgi:transposase